MTDEFDTVAAEAATATTEETFDALAFFSGTSLPRDSVTTYANLDAAYRLAEIREKVEAARELEDAEGTSITDESFYADPDEIEALQDALKASAVTFALRGLAPAAKTALERKARASHPYVEGGENREYNEAFNASLIASSIVTVSNVKGQTDPNKWDDARVRAFADNAPESEFNKLALAVLKVNYVADAIDLAVSADFS